MPHSCLLREPEEGCDFGFLAVSGLFRMSFRVAVAGAAAVALAERYPMTYRAASVGYSSSRGGLVAVAGVQAVVDWVQPGSSVAVPLAGHWRMELHSAALGQSSPVPRFPRMTTRMRTTNWRIVVSSLCRSARVPVRHLVRPDWLSSE